MLDPGRVSPGEEVRSLWGGASITLDMAPGSGGRPSAEETAGAACGGWSSGEERGLRWGRPGGRWDQARQDDPEGGFEEADPGVEDAPEGSWVLVPGCTEMLQEGGPLPGPESGLLSNTQK